MAQRWIDRVTLKQPWLLVGIFGVSLLVRVWASNVPINVDEIKWLFRGLTFYGELVDRDLAGTYLQHHPGVTTMWLNGFGLMLHCVLRDWFPTRLHLDQTSLQACAQTLKATPFIPVESYVITRLIQACVTSGLMVGAFVLLRQGFGMAIALISVAILTLEPFFISYQRLLTTDALQTDFLLLAVLSLLLYWRKDSSRWLLIGSGVLMGLATATKTPSLTIVPGLVACLVLIELGAWRSVYPPRGIRRQLLDLALWGAVLVATIVVIWPALWVAPITTISQLLHDLKDETERGAFFFMGQTTDSPNALFYPVVLLYRLSPVVWIGLISSIVVLLIPTFRRRLEHRSELMALLLVTASMLLVLSSSSNKIDRYIVPLIPWLAILVAAGWWTIQQSVLARVQSSSLVGERDRLPSSLVRTGGAIALTLLTLQAVTVSPYLPYYLTYYNPFLGGPRAAERVLMMGNGEGLEQAADWLNQAPNAKEMVVASWYLPSFAPYFEGTSFNINSVLSSGDNQTWLRQAHRLVLYINQRQRQLPNPALLDYFAAQGSLHTVSLNGLEYAAIYPGPLALPQDVEQAQAPATPIANQALQLQGYTLTQSNQAVDQPIQPVQVTLFWQTRQPLSSDTEATLVVLQDQQTVLTTASPLLDGWWIEGEIEAGQLVRDARTLSLPVGRYTLAVRLADGTTATPLSEFEVTAPLSGAIAPSGFQ